MKCDLKFFTILVIGIISNANGQTTCDASTCSPPDCQCFGSIPPSGSNLTWEETPQIVWITFDDAMAEEAIPVFQNILLNRKNPNGCNISMTFFLTHEYTDYHAVYEFWRFGSEVGSNSISKVANTTYWQTATSEQWQDEMLGMKEMLNTYAMIPLDDINGMRAPYLEMGGDEMFSMASNNSNFKYDCSWTSQDYIDDPIYPYTLDYNNLGTSQDCPIGSTTGNCPIYQYRGFWELPMVDSLSLHNNTPCAIVTACEPQPQSEQEVLEFFELNFERHFNTSKAPYGIFLSLAWFTENQNEGSSSYNLDGFLKFLDHLLLRNDTYIVTLSQTLEWMSNPLSVKELLDSQNSPFTCPSRVIPDACYQYFNCDYLSTPTTEGNARSMTSCVPCPPSYPWVGNVAGEI